MILLALIANAALLIGFCWSWRRHFTLADLRVPPLDEAVDPELDEQRARVLDPQMLRRCADRRVVENPLHEDASA